MFPGALVTRELGFFQTSYLTFTFLFYVKYVS